MLATESIVINETWCLLILLAFRVDYVEADMGHAHTPYYVVQTLITNLLELDVCRTASEKEQALLQHITDFKLREKMFLLNDLLGTHVSGGTNQTARIQSNKIVTILRAAF